MSRKHKNAEMGVAPKQENTAWAIMDIAPPWRSPFAHPSQQSLDVAQYGDKLPEDHPWWKSEFLCPICKDLVATSASHLNKVYNMKWTEQEQVVIKELAKQLDISEEQVLRQALRQYQATHFPVGNPIYSIMENYPRNRMVPPVETENSNVNNSQ